MNSYNVPSWINQFFILDMKVVDKIVHFTNFNKKCTAYNEEKVQYLHTIARHLSDLAK